MLVLVVCSNFEEECKVQVVVVVVVKVQQEVKVEGVVKQYDMVVVVQDWEWVCIYGGLLLDQYKDIDVVVWIELGYVEVKVKVEVVCELCCMQVLWQYNQILVGKGMQFLVQIYSKECVDVDGSGVKMVQLVFCDYFKWEWYVYLVLQVGDFCCL